jgi:1,4-dihydroxy-6-naphthoate synthase
MRIRIGYCPDPDDAYMFHALAAGEVRVPGLEVEPVLEDIEALNRRARAADLEVTAISAATYAIVADRYRIMDAGAAMALERGPLLVARSPIDPADIPHRVVAIPGSHTTASLLLRLYCGDPPLIEVAFDRIAAAVVEGQADLGLLIHEGQITYRTMGLVKVLDLGEAWQRATRLPLPLGVNVIRRDLDEPTQRRLARALHDSIAWAHAHPEEALDHAMAYARGMDRETCRRFVRAFVNDYALRLGEEGRAALERLFAEAHRRGLIEAAPPLDPIGVEESDE